MPGNHWRVCFPSSADTVLTWEAKRECEITLLGALPASVKSVYTVSTWASVSPGAMGGEKREARPPVEVGRGDFSWLVVSPHLSRGTWWGVGWAVWPWVSYSPCLSFHGKQLSENIRAAPTTLCTEETLRNCCLLLSLIIEFLLQINLFCDLSFLSWVQKC